MEEIIVQFETFTKSISLMESMLANCRFQLHSMESKLLLATGSEDEKTKIEKLMKLSQFNDKESKLSDHSASISREIIHSRTSSQNSSNQEKDDKNKSDQELIRQVLKETKAKIGVDEKDTSSGKKSSINSESAEEKSSRRESATSESIDTSYQVRPNRRASIVEGEQLLRSHSPVDEKNVSVRRKSILKSAISNPVVNAIGQPSIVVSTPSQIALNEPIRVESTNSDSKNLVANTSKRNPLLKAGPKIPLPKLDLPKPDLPSIRPLSPIAQENQKETAQASVDKKDALITPVVPANSPQPSIQNPIERNQSIMKSSTNVAMKPIYANIFNRRLFKQPATVSNGVSQSMLKLNNDADALFHPHSMAIQVWNSIFLVSNLILAMLIPTAVALESTMGTGLPVLSIINCVLIIIDICIKLNTGVLMNQQLEMNTKEVRRYFLRNGALIFDFFAGFPYVLVVDALTLPYSLQRSQGRFICMFNASVIISIFYGPFRVGWCREKITQFFRSKGVNQALVESVKMMIFMVAYWHFNACFTITLRKVKISTPPVLYETDWAHYTAAVYGAASEMLANGWGSDEPITTIDRWFKIINMMISATFQALFIGNISAFMIGVDSSGKRFNEILDEVNQYITYKGFGENLRNRIIKYYQFKYARGKYFDENRILEELNQPLRQYIALRECQDLIVKVPFFKDADKYFITQVVMILKVNHYLPGDYIIEEGTSGDHMYFIASGTVEAIVNGVVRAKLSPGLFFGEIALLFGRMKRTASIRALSHCILYSLSRQDLNSVLELNPVMAERMRQVAADRLANDQKLKTQSTQLQAVIQKTAEDSPTSK